MSCQVLSVGSVVSTKSNRCGAVWVSFFYCHSYYNQSTLHHNMIVYVYSYLMHHSLTLALSTKTQTPCLHSSHIMASTGHFLLPEDCLYESNPTPNCLPGSTFSCKPTLSALICLKNLFFSIGPSGFSLYLLLYLFFHLLGLSPDLSVLYAGRSWYYMFLFAARLNHC